MYPVPRPHHSSPLHPSLPVAVVWSQGAVAIRLCVPRPRTGIDEEASQLSRVASPK